jgi:hypothetical protein
VSLRHGQQDVLIGYDSPTGWKETVTGIATQEQLSIAPQAVNAGYTHFITARWQNDWFVVAYNSETGSFSWVPAVAELDELSVPVTNGFGTWATGYTHMQAYTAGGHDGVLLFQPGRLRFMAFPSESALGLGGAGGSDLGMQQIASFDLAALREAGLLAADPTAVSVADFEGTPSLLFYDEVSGIVDLKQIVLQDEAFQVVSVDRGEQVATTSDGSAGKWRWQLTSLTFVSLNSDLGCITFDGELAEFRLFGDTPVVVVR